MVPLKETVLMMLFKSMKAMVYSPDGNTEFDNVTGVLQRDTLAPYIVIICQGYILWTSVNLIKKNSLTPMKTRKRYLVETTTDDLALFTRLHRLEQAAEGIGLYENTNKIELMYFK